MVHVNFHECFLQSAMYRIVGIILFFFFQAEDGIRDYKVTGVQTCALPIFSFKDFNNDNHPHNFNYKPKQNQDFQDMKTLLNLIQKTNLECEFAMYL